MVPEGLGEAKASITVPVAGGQYCRLWILAWPGLRVPTASYSPLGI